MLSADPTCPGFAGETCARDLVGFCRGNGACARGCGGPAARSIQGFGQHSTSPHLGLCLDAAVLLPHLHHLASAPVWSGAQRFVENGLTWHLWDRFSVKGLRAASEILRNPPQRTSREAFKIWEKMEALRDAPVDIMKDSCVFDNCTVTHSIACLAGAHFPDAPIQPRIFLYMEPSPTFRFMGLPYLTLDYSTIPLSRRRHAMPYTT